MQFSKAINEYLANNPDWVPFVDLIICPPKAEDIINESPDAEGCDLLKQPDYLLDSFVTMYALYQRIRMEGETHRWAEMLALREPPRIMTDAVYLEGRKMLGDQMSDAQLKHYLLLAKRRGFTPNATDHYNPCLARFPGDPEAFMPASEGREYAKKLAIKRGCALHGSDGSEIVADRTPDQDPYETAPKLAPDLVRANARRMIRNDPSLRKKKPQEIREMVVAKHGQQS